MMTQIHKGLLGLVMLFLIFSIVGTVLPQEVTEVPTAINATSETSEDGEQRTPAQDAELALIEAENATERVNTTISNFNTLLQTVEVFFAVIGVVIALIGIIGFQSIKRSLTAELKKDNDAAIAAFRAEINSDRSQLVTQQSEVTETVKTVKDVPQEFAKIRQQYDRAIRAMTLVQLGEQQMREGNPEAALRTFQEAYALDMTNRAVNYYLGELYIMQRDLSQAASHLKKAHINYTSSAVVPFVSDELSDEVLSGTLFPPATAALAYVYRLTGDKVYKSTGNINERNKFYGRAVDYYSRALEQDPNVKDINGESVNGMVGALHRQWGHMEEAIHHYKEAAKLTPSRSYPFNNLAMIYFGQGDVETATPYFDDAIRLSKQRIDNHPTDYWAYFDLINGHLACARPDEAIKTFNHILPMIGVRGPLESFLNGLQVLARSPRPPQPITIVHDLIAQVQEELDGLDSKNDPVKGES